MTRWIRLPAGRTRLRTCLLALVMSMSFAPAAWSRPCDPTLIPPVPNCKLQKQQPIQFSGWETQYWDFYCSGDHPYYWGLNSNIVVCRLRTRSEVWPSPSSAASVSDRHHPADHCRSHADRSGLPPLGLHFLQQHRQVGHPVVLLRGLLATGAAILQLRRLGEGLGCLVQLGGEEGAELEPAAVPSAFVAT